ATDDDAELHAELGGGDEIGGEPLDGRLIDAEVVIAAEGFAGQLDDHAPVERITHGVGEAPLLEAAFRSALAGRGRNLGGEVGLLLLDALTEGVADEARDLDRTADLALGVLERLRDRLLVVEDERLLEHADLLVESLQARLDDLLDHSLGLALLAKLVGEHVLLALDGGRIEPGRIE